MSKIKLFQQMCGAAAFTAGICSAGLWWWSAWLQQHLINAAAKGLPPVIEAVLTSQSLQYNVYAAAAAGIAAFFAGISSA